jgi:hypothetical protein
MLIIRDVIVTNLSPLHHPDLLLCQAIQFIYPGVNLGVGIIDLCCELIDKTDNAIWSGHGVVMTTIHPIR